MKRGYTRGEATPDTPDEPDDSTVVMFCKTLGWGWRLVCQVIGGDVVESYVSEFMKELRISHAQLSKPNFRTWAEPSVCETFQEEKSSTCTLTAVFAGPGFLRSE